jgi:hypothetical protein
MKENEMSGHVAHTRERRGICRVLFGKPEKKRHHMEDRRR